MNADRVKYFIEPSFVTRRYEVWCDLSTKQLQDIEGIEQVTELNRNHFSVWLDPRYVTWQVLENIRKCAENEK